MLCAVAPADDCNQNGIPDDQELETVVLFQDFDGSALPPGVTEQSSGLWHFGSACRPAGNCGQDDFAYFGVDATCTFATGSGEMGLYEIDGVELPDAPSELTFCSYYAGEGGDAFDEYDLATVWVRPEGAPGLGDFLEFTSATGNQAEWEERSLDLSAYRGERIDLIFSFSSDDKLFNTFFGWGLDDVRITADFDVNGNGVLDECECLVATTCLTSPNSAGTGALIGTSGSVSVAANDLLLVTTGLPPNQFGIYYYGPNAAQVPFGEGIRCIDPPVLRLTPVSTGSGEATLQIDFTSADQNPGNHMFPGATQLFQFWYRDPPGGGSNFNLSDALQITFCD